MMELLSISVTYHMPQNRVSDAIMHVTLNTMNGVLYLIHLVWPWTWYAMVTYKLGYIEAKRFNHEIVRILDTHLKAIP